MSRSRYVKAPQPTESTRPRYEAVLRVLSGETSVTDAAMSLGLSRLRFQTLLHRGLTGLLKELEERPKGRPALPESERQLREEVLQLQRDNARLTQQVEMSARMMGIASQWMHKGLRTAARLPKTKPVAEAAMSDVDEDGPLRCLTLVAALRGAGLPSRLCALACGASEATVRRWRRRRREDRPMRRRRGPRPTVTTSTHETEALLSRMRGAIGAAPLARATRCSRRCAAAVKRGYLAKQEATRREDATRVTVLPGVIRGFDATFVGKTPVLVSADAGVPYRTSVDVADSYDDAAVSAAVARDFERHGAPLVWRVDRWKAHATPRVLDILRAHGVLVLHGPPRCPQFYGQIERQNREHRAWFESHADVGLHASCDEMREVFNEVVPRRSLGWRTAGAVWRAREAVTVRRDELRDEVDELTRKLQKAHRVAYPGLFERLAIQQALINRGLLRLEKGGWR